uniref:Uncharacterized protein LOC105041831 isoform X3 n=1 Tax=Elaeis guineensis var. tenera TaxID=51953 RepID=A0A8N4F1Y5_ELAGV|nr:uncharacterized protein LOC105041831 isoform X3 [Elaeis guineensis]
MDKNEDSGSPGWGSSFFKQTTEDVAKAFFAAASAATVQSPRPSVVFSSRDNSNGRLQKLQHQLTKVFKGFSPPPEVKGAYNPEVLTSQKRQWARFQLQSLEQRPMKEPSRVFESMVVVGLHPDVDVQALQKLLDEKNNEFSKKQRSLLNCNHQIHAEPNLEPQVLFVYPPEKQLPLKYKDLLSFCFPGGVEVHAVERTPSLSELNEILLGQEQLKQSNQSFVFRLQVADDSTLYGCCILVEEVVRKPSTLVSMFTGEQSFSSSLSRHIITTSRCYCILSRLPFFELHFGLLRSIFIEERFEQLTKGIDMLNLLSSEEVSMKDSTYDKTSSPVEEHHCTEDTTNLMRCSYSSTEFSTPTKISDNGKAVDNQLHEVNLNSKEVIQDNTAFDVNQETTDFVTEGESGLVIQDSHDNSADETMRGRQSERRNTEAVLPLLRCRLYESSESSASFQGSPSEDRNFRSDTDEVELEEPSSSGQEDSSVHSDILEWAKANGHGSLQIICEYYQLHCPARGSTVVFQPLEHLYPLEFHRPGETVLHIADSTIDLRSCNTSLEVAEAHSALLAEEEAIALSVWTVACICGCLRLENIIAMFAGALLEKQIVIVCSNLGILSAAVLSVIPLIRPYQWQSLLMPILPNDMLDFLDAPVPYIVGIKNKTADIQPKLANVILIDANKNQVEAAKGFLAVLRSYLDSLCSNLRSHTITNVQSNNDKVSLLLKESFIDSFPNRDRSFMKLFVDTQLFSVHTDLVLSFYQKD